jgi:cyclase
MDADGTQKGFDLELTKAVSLNSNIPVIASGGAGANMKHFKDVFDMEQQMQRLRRRFFHYNKIKIADLKDIYRKIIFP